MIPNSLGAVSTALLRKYKLPPGMLTAGTCVEFRIKDGTQILQEDQIIAKFNSFDMLRLIASDPNTEVIIERIRKDGTHTTANDYFPVGTVIGRFREQLEVPGYGDLPVDIMVARADVPLVADASNVERRENGLLFVDENDAVRI